MPKKPIKWGIKIFARCSKNGFLHNFSVYTGASSNPMSSNFGATENIVLQLCKNLKSDNDDEMAYLFADNFFTTNKLALELKERKILLLGTVRENRIRDALKNMKSEKEMKLIGRGNI
jgi:hypothetical protein